ncbi:MAG: hypothetical protein A2X23_12490 [Chloroflexi bacterium GWC2_73_18]|nr:MAG: hypothetical protein A2X23_12490 [Chloroflexi bacterium GWC2_73_18]
MLDQFLNQGELVLRLLVAAALGAAIGFEREIHDHPAGTRTHLLVALGSTIFTVLSIYGFAGLLGPGEGTAPDPTRIAAQVVSGIGFLGAGAIIHYGTSIRGLTTAASLWATASIGLAVGAGDYVLGVVGAAIVVFSLWPLNVLVARVHRRPARVMRMRLALGRLEATGQVSEVLTAIGADLTAIQSRRVGAGRYEVELELRLPARVPLQTLVAQLNGLADAEVIESVEDVD